MATKYVTVNGYKVPVPEGFGHAPDNFDTKGGAPGYTNVQGHFIANNVYNTYMHKPPGGGAVVPPATDPNWANTQPKGGTTAPKPVGDRGTPSTGTPPVPPKIPQGTSGSYSSRTVNPRPKPAPAGYHNIAIPNPASDPDYLYSKAALHEAHQQYGQQDTLARQQYATSYSDQLAGLGWNPRARSGQGDWNTANRMAGTYGAAAQDVSDQFNNLSMGGTPYVTQMTNMRNDYTNRLGDVNRARTDFNSQRDLESRQYSANIEAERKKALRAAISRISQSYGINPVQIPSRGGTVAVKNP